MRLWGVDFALSIFDEYSGTRIKDANLMFQVNGRQYTPLLKPEGYYVFKGLCEQNLTVEINRPHYLPERAYVIKSCLDPGLPVVNIRLLREYSGIYRDCEWVTVECPAHSYSAVFTKEDSLRPSAIPPDEDGGRISVIGYGTAMCLGKRFTLAPGDKSFVLLRMISPNIYRTDITPPETAGYGALYRVYMSKSLESRVCHIPVDCGTASKITQTLYCREGDDKWLSLPAAEQ